MTGRADPDQAGVTELPLGGGPGVELVGVPGRPQVAALVQLVKTAYLQHRLVLVRGLRLSHRSQLRVAAGLGSVVGVQPPGNRRPRPNVRFESVRVAETDRWHADLSWSSEVEVTGLLYCLKAGEGADPTSFADAMTGYQRLDRSRQREIEGLRAFHHVVPRGPDRVSPVRRLVAASRRVRVPRDLSVVSVAPGPSPGVAHPVVDRHPRTGQPFVRLGDHAWTVEGFETEAGRRLVERITHEVVGPDNTWTHRWEPGDLVVYDNLSLLHRRETGGDDGGQRLLRRVLVVGRA